MSESERCKTSWIVYPWEGNALDDPEFQEWTDKLPEEERIIHHQVAIDMMLLEREPPYEIDIVTGRDA